MSVVLEAKNINVVYGKKDRKTYAVQDVSFELHAGETLGVVGESGCGKTTVALALMGLLGNQSTVTGTLVLNGKERDLSRMSYKDWRALRGSELAMVFQDSLASLNPLKRIGEQIAESMYVKKSMSKTQARKEAIALLEMVEIPDAESRARLYPHECSGGMRQRVMIAMALANKPSIVICDEPTTALDVTVQAQILSMIKRIQEEFSMAMMIVTHDLGVISSVSDRMNVMYGGKIVESGPTRDLLSSPSHPYTQALLDAMPTLASSDEDLCTIPGAPPTLNKLFSWCPFGPRCEFHTEKCDDGMPPLVESEDDSRTCACVHPLGAV
jgi:oligopeptide transport system ATP-binding protein